MPTLGRYSKGESLAPNSSLAEKLASAAAEDERRRLTAANLASMKVDYTSIQGVQRLCITASR